MGLVTPFITAFACLSACCLVCGNPVPISSNLPWSRPCLPDETASGVLDTFAAASPHPVNDLLSSLVVKVAEALERARVLKEQIFHHRLDGSQSSANYLDRLEHHYLPHDVISWSNVEQTGAILRTYYRHLSTVYVYLELVEGSCTADNCRTNVLDHVNSLQRKILDVLCHYSIVLHSLDLSIDSYVTRNDIPEMRAPPNQAAIDSRDYVIARDIVRLFSAICTNHSRAQGTLA